MKRKYLGDSFDIVKRFWYERLADIEPLVAHPQFVPPEIRADFERMIGIPVFESNTIPEEPFGLFLDPDTGIPLPTAGTQRASPSYAPLSFIVAEQNRLKPKYVICFDQSHDRNCGLTKPEQRQSKMAALRNQQIASFYYVSHAPFLFAAVDDTNLELVRRRLVERGIPEWRFETPE